MHDGIHAVLVGRLAHLLLQGAEFALKIMEMRKRVLRFFQHRPARFGHKHLRHVANLDAALAVDDALIRLQILVDDFEQRALSAAVHTHQADTVLGLHTQRNILQHKVCAKGF